MTMTPTKDEPFGLFGAERVREAAELEHFRKTAYLKGEETPSRINTQSETWTAVKDFIRDKIEGDYLPTLKNRSVDYPDTQYARGAIEALESLLEMAGEEI